MAHIDNRSLLTSAHVRLLSIGSRIFDEVRLPIGYGLSVVPFDREANKATTISFALLKNGQPSEDGEVSNDAKAQVARIINRMHPTERDGLLQDGFTLSVKPAILKADEERRARARKAKGFGTDKRGLLVEKAATPAAGKVEEKGGKRPERSRRAQSTKRGGKTAEGAAAGSGSGQLSTGGDGSEGTDPTA